MTQTTHAVQAHKAIVREDQRVTETWRPHIALIEEQAVAHDDAGVFPDNFLDQYLGDLD